MEIEPGMREPPEFYESESSLRANLSRKDKEEWLHDRMYYDTKIKFKGTERLLVPSGFRGNSASDKMTKVYSIAYNREREDYVTKKIEKMDEDEIEDKLYEDYGEDLDEPYEYDPGEYGDFYSHNGTPKRKAKGVKLI